MGGKSSTSTNQVTVPPQVLAQYQTVNADAQATAQTPFQQYSGQFVAPVNSQETSGISGINAAATQAQPYYTQAGQTLGQAQAAAQPYYSTATSDVTGAQSVGTGLAAAANQNYGAAYAGAQPYQQAATGEALAGGQAVNADPITGQQINQYMSPYLQDVLGSESGLLNQNNQQQQAGQLGDAITSGAFGGDRAGIAAANLEQQQNLANANIYSGILNTGYNNALATAQQQQGVNLGAAQANRAASQATASSLANIGQQGYTQGMGLASAQQGLGAQQFGQGVTAATTQAGIGQDVYGTGAATSAAQANLGTAAQTASEQGAQAQLAAGQVQQQTQQAQDTALYNQFEQQQSYPFQVDQFLANIAEGTGALSGSTTTTTTPGSLFSDERLKEDIEPIGKTFDGQNIVKFRYKGDKKTQIGLIAQDVERHHPKAVGLAGGYRTVDYDKATEDAASRGHFASGGLAGRNAYAYGGYPMLPGMYPGDIQAILQSQEQMYAPYSSSGIYGAGSTSSPHGGSSYVPQASLPVSHLAVANTNTPQRPTALQDINQLGQLANNPLVTKGLGAAQNAWNGFTGQGGQDAAPATFDPASTDSIDALMSNGLYGDGNKRGGRIGRDIGGATDDSDLPYGQGNGAGLSIPDANPGAKLTLPNSPVGNSQSSPLNQISQLGNAVQGAGKIAQGVGDAGSWLSGLGGSAAGAADAAGAAGLGGASLGGGLAAAGAAGTAAAGAGAASIADILPFLLLKSGGRAERKGYADGGDPNDEADDVALGSLAGAGDPLSAMMLGVGSQITNPPPQQNVSPAQLVAMDYAQHGVTPPSSNPSAPTPHPQRAHSLGSAQPAPFQAAANDTPPAPGPMDMAPTNPQPVTADQLQNINASMPATPADIVRKAYEAAPSEVEAPPPAGDLGSALTGGQLPQMGLGSGPQGGSATDPIQGLPNPQGTPGGPASGIMGALGKAGSAVEGGLHDALSKIPGLLTDPHTLIPILTGLAAWTGAPTRNPITALAQGLGAGAQSYATTQNSLANAGLTQAQARTQGVTASAGALANSKALQQAAYMGRIRLDPNGPILDQATGLRYSNIQGAPGVGTPGMPAGPSAAPGPAAGAPAATSYKYLGPNAASALPIASQQYISDSPMGFGNNPGRLAQSTAQAGDIYAAGADAKTTLTNLNEQAEGIFSPDRKGPLTQGALAPILQPYVEKYNATIEALGPSILGPDYKKAELTGLGDTQIAEKLQMGSAAAQASGAGQMSLAALQDFTHLSPGPNLDPKAAANLLAQNAMLATKASDRRNALIEANQSAQTGGFGNGGSGVETQTMMDAFDKDNTPQMYSNMRDTLSTLYQTPMYQTIRTGLSAPPDSALYKTTVEGLDKFGAERGIPRFSRILTGE